MPETWGAISGIFSISNLIDQKRYLICIYVLYSLDLLFV